MAERTLKPEALLVMTTCGTAEEAEKLASALLNRRLAACVSRLEGIVSTYRWNSALQSDQETLLLIKTTPARLEAVTSLIEEFSSYELPEILAVPIEGGSAKYLQWLADAVSLEE